MPNYILASNDDIHQIRKLIEEKSFPNITDHQLASLMGKFRKETNLGIGNYQFHVDVGKDFHSHKIVAAISVLTAVLLPVPYGPYGYSRIIKM